MDVLRGGNGVGGAEGNLQPGGVISKIEDTLENIIEALSENRVLTIPLRNRRSRNENLIRFPANTAGEVKKFSTFTYHLAACMSFSFLASFLLACLLRILHICHEALVNGHIITKRSDPPFIFIQVY